MSVSEAKTRRRAENRERAQRRKEARVRDRALAPVTVSTILGAQVRVIAAAMRRNGITEQVTVRDARRWKSDPSTAPDWVLEVFAECAARDARREYRVRQAAEAHEMRMLRAEQTAADKVRRGLRLRRFNENEEMWLDDWGFRLSKDLVRGADPDALDDFSVRVLRLCGVNPHRHETWWVHAGDCDGTGSASCAATAD